MAFQTETACDDLSLPSLCPFLGNPCDDGSMHVCATDQLNDFLSSCPLTTICHTKYGKQRQKYEYRHYRCGCSFQINVRYSVDGQTCHVDIGTIPDDHFDMDENQSFQRIMVHVELYPSFMAETFLIVRFLLRSSWRTGCITFRSINLGIIMKSVL
jgi:hypothetical protein